MSIHASGLLRHRPVQPILGDKISIGVIGTAETVEGFERWLKRARSGIEGHSTKQPNPPFHGFGNVNPFRCGFEVGATAKRVLPRRDITDLDSSIAVAWSAKTAEASRPTNPT